MYPALIPVLDALTGLDGLWTVWAPESVSFGCKYASEHPVSRCSCYFLFSKVGISAIAVNPPHSKLIYLLMSWLKIYLPLLLC